MLFCFLSFLFFLLSSLFACPFPLSLFRFDFRRLLQFKGDYQLTLPIENYARKLCQAVRILHTPVRATIVSHFIRDIQLFVNQTKSGLSSLYVS